MALAVLASVPTMSFVFWALSVFSKVFGDRDGRAPISVVVLDDSEAGGTTVGLEEEDEQDDEDDLSGAGGMTVPLFLWRCCASVSEMS